MKMKKLFAVILSVALLWTALPAALAEEAEAAAEPAAEAAAETAEETAAEIAAETVEETVAEAVADTAEETVEEAAAETAGAAGEETIGEAVEEAAVDTVAEPVGEMLGVIPAAGTNQKLDASYTLALNAINAEDYETAKEYLEICFAYCDRESNPVMYADLLLKRACIQVIEEKNEMALLTLDAALAVQPELADAYLVKTQICTSQGQIDQAIANLEKYIGLTGDTSLYETVAQLQEALGDYGAAQEAYEKFAAGAGKDLQEAGFQTGLYQMQAGRLEEAVASFEVYAEDETYGAGAEYNIGVCKMNLGDYAGALEAFDACQAKGGDFEGFYYNRGICRLLSENWESAAEDFAASIESEPFVADATYNLGLCQMQTEQYEAAVATFTGLIGDGEKAEESEGEQAEAQAQASDAVYYYRAVCNAALGNLEAALADYTVCIDHGYELSTTYYQRAQVYAAMGDTENQNSDLANSLKYAE